MAPALKTGFTHLISQLGVLSSSRMFILEGEPGGRLELASAIASHLNRQLRIWPKDEDWKRWIEGIPSADRASAILFFDEADALFGKRSEVQDSHQVYAELSSLFSGLIFLGVGKSYTLPSLFTQCAKTIVVSSFLT